VLTEVLIESGCDMNETTRQWAPLHAAAARNHYETLATLIKHGCDINIQDKDGLNALCYCIINENIKCIDLLIKCGCKIDMKMIRSNECLQSQLTKYPLIEKMLTSEMTRMKTLKEIARQSIRRSLNQRLIHKLNYIPLPPKLRDYIALREVFNGDLKVRPRLGENNSSPDAKEQALTLNTKNSLDRTSSSSSHSSHLSYVDPYENKNALKQYNHKKQSDLINKEPNKNAISVVSSNNSALTILTQTSKRIKKSKTYTA
jgi:ankyrin repeat protein